MKDRIAHIIRAKNLTAAEFALRLGIQPSNISHLLAGRNNPSLEVMKRIMERYPTLNPEWLIAGKGDMWRTVPGEQAELFDQLPPDPKDKKTRTAQKEEPQVVAAPSKQIKNIVVYFTDGTYEEFTLAQ